MTYQRDKVLARMEKMRAEEAAKAKPLKGGDYSDFADAIPGQEELNPQTDKIVERQSFIDSIKILDAWTKLGGKPPKHIASGQTNGIMVFCLNPHHDNTNTEAAQLDIAKNLFICHSCEAGGGPVALAALSQGNTATSSGRLRSDEFAKAEEHLLLTYGWRRTTSSTGKTDLLPPYVEEPAPAPAPKAKPEPEVETPERKLATVTPIAEDEDDPEDEDAVQEQLDIKPLDWRGILPRDSFLWEYMEAASNDDAVEAFHFGYALCLLSVTTGRNVMLDDTYPLAPNVYIALIGDSGTGKSKSSTAMRHVLDAVLPFDNDEEPQVGARWASNPSSGGGLVQTFIRTIKGIGPGAKPYWERRGDVKAVVDYGEMESLTSRMQKDTTGLRSMLMDLYDGKPKVGSIAKGDGDGGHYAENPFCSQITTLQPRNIPNLLSQKDVVSGTLNRYMFFAGEYKTRQPRGKSILPYFDSAIGHLEKIRDWANPDKRLMDWADEAGDLYDTWHSGILEPARVENTDMLNRSDVQMKKLCLLFAINSMHEQIELVDVERALQLWPWLSSLYGLVGKEVSTSEKSALEERVLAKVKAAHSRGIEDVSFSEIFRQLNSNSAKGYTIEREDILRALKTLTLSGDLGHCEPGRDRDGKPINKRGRPSEKWYVA